MDGSWGRRYAIAASTLALVVALGGTAYAVNTVRSSDIVNGTIQSEDIGTNAVRSVDIAQRGVSIADVATSSLGHSERLFAHINGSGLASSAGVDAFDHPGAAWLITFDRDVSQCAVTVTARGQDDEYGNYAYGVDTGEIDVSTFDPGVGATTNTPVDVVVVC